MEPTSHVRILFFEQSIGCDLCAPTRRALEQIVGEIPQATLEIFNLILDKERAAEHGIDRVPAIIIASEDGGRVRYYGSPLGNELPTVVEAVRMLGTRTTPLTSESCDRLKALAKPVHLQVFFTPTCVYCPRMIALANQAAIESPYVSTTAIDATEFPDLVRRFNVNGVPKTVVNDTTEILGAVPEEDFINAIVAAGR